MGLINHTQDPNEAQEPAAEERTETPQQEQAEIQEEATEPAGKVDYEGYTKDMESRVPPKLKNAFTRVVVAGMKFLFSDQTNGMVNEYLSGEGDPAKKLGEGVAGLMGTLYKESKGSMPGEIMVPAGIQLLLEASEYAERANLIQVTPQILAGAIETFMYKVMGMAGLNPDQFDQMLDKMGGQGAEPAEGPGGMLAQAQPAHPGA